MKLLFLGLVAASLVASPAQARRYWLPWSPFPGNAWGFNDCAKGFFLGFNRECWRRTY